MVLRSLWRTCVEQTSLVYDAVCSGTDELRVKCKANSSVWTCSPSLSWLYFGVNFCSAQSEAGGNTSADWVNYSCLNICSQSIVVTGQRSARSLWVEKGQFVTACVAAHTDTPPSSHTHTHEPGHLPHINCSSAPMATTCSCSLSLCHTYTLTLSVKHTHAHTEGELYNTSHYIQRQSQGRTVSDQTLWPPLTCHLSFQAPAAEAHTHIHTHTQTRTDIRTKKTHIVFQK